MHTSERIERTLERAIVLAQGAGAPPLLASAMHYAVFPGGHRIRPSCVSPSPWRAGTSIPRLPTRPPPRSNCCTARRSSMTTCRASTTPIPGGASPRFTPGSARRSPCLPETL